MLQAQYVGDRKISISEYTPKNPEANEVQIRVSYVGLCGTDLHVVHGSMDKRVDIPLCFGHEMSGVVETVGSSVTQWKAGDFVTVMPLDWDGTCPACLSGHQHICQNLNFVGIDSPGALQTLWNVAENWLVRLPNSISLLNAALVEPVAVAFHDVKRAEVKPDEKIVIIGGGPIGLLIGLVARNIGAEVLIVELDSNRRELIDSLGFKSVDSTKIDLEEYVNLWTGTKGADTVFEVSGSSVAVLNCIDLVKVRGKLIIVAIHGQPREIKLQRVFWRELSIIGVRVYERTDFESAIDLIASGVIPSEKIISAVLPLSKLTEAIERLEKGLAMKILIDVQQVSAE